MDAKTTPLIAKRARAFRRALTEPEVMLWSRLKTRGTGKPIFRRQFAYGSMIFDFYCVAARLAVEVDGSTHWSEEKQEKDAARDRWLAAQGIAVLRIPASWVYRDLSGAADAVILRVGGEDSRRIGRGGGFPSPPLALRRAVPLSRFAGKEGRGRGFQ